MKKIIGILGVAVMAATMFFSANSLNSNSSDASLVSLMGMNSANAEGNGGILGTSIPGKCTRLVPSYVCTCSTVPMIEVEGKDTECLGYLGFCIPEECH